MADNQAGQVITQHVLELDHDGVRRTIPHGPKALFIRSAVVFGNHVTAIMDLEPLKGIIEDHFEVAKGTDVQEALEQAGGIAAMLKVGPGYLTFVTSADEVKWPGQVKYGDTVIIQAELEARNGAPTRGRGSGVVTVNGSVVCSGKFSFYLKKAEEELVQAEQPSVLPAVLLHHTDAGVPGLAVRQPP